MNARNFMIGVINLAASAYVLGGWPQHYWIYFAVQGFIMIVVRTYTWYSANLHLYLLDYCWVTAFVLCGATTYALVVRLLGAFTPSASGDAFNRAAFLIFFTTASGPLSGAVAVTGNSLVFHSFEHFSNMYIHAAPMLTAWALRWHGAVAEAAWPGLIGNGGNGDADLFSELFVPTTAYYFSWWVPYTLWLITDGVSRPAKGYDTVFNCFAPLLQGPLGIDNLRIVAVVYMTLHALVCLFAHAISAFLFFPYFYVHTTFVVLMLLAATSAGAKFYNYAMLDAYAEKVGALKDKKSAVKKSKELV